MNKQEIQTFLFDNYSLVQEGTITLEQFFNKYKEHIHLNKSNKIAIIQFRALGDAILLSGFIREVKLNNPDKDLVIICDNNNYPIFQYCPYAFEVINICCNTSADIYQFITEVIHILPSLFLDYQFDTIFCTQIGVNNLYAMLCANLVGADNIIGFGANSQQMYLLDQYPQPTEWDFLLDNNVLYPKNLWNDMRRKYYLLSSIGYIIHSEKLEIWLNNTDNVAALKNKKYVVIGLGARERKKKYPNNLLLSALKQIQLIDTDMIFVLLGGATEQTNEFDNTDINILNLIDKLTILESARVIQDAYCYIGNDTALIHIAEAFDIPIIGLYAEAKDKMDDNPGLLSSIYRFAPVNVSHFKLLQPNTSLLPCKNIHAHGGCSAAEAHCITQIKPVDIWNAFILINKGDS